MAQNLIINGVTYNSVNSLSIPKSAGGNAVFPDTSDANATESDILSGKTAYVNGVKITGTGTGSGGGGGGWDAEEWEVGLGGNALTLNGNVSLPDFNAADAIILYGNLPPYAPWAAGFRFFGTQKIIFKFTTVMETSALLPFSNLPIGALALAETLVEVKYLALNGLSSLSKVWVPISCVTVAKDGLHTLADTYIEAASKPAGWDNDWNTYSPYINIYWGVTLETFEAIE